MIICYSSNGKLIQPERGQDQICSVKSFLVAVTERPEKDQEEKQDDGEQVSADFSGQVMMVAWTRWKQRCWRDKLRC